MGKSRRVLVLVHPQFRPDRAPKRMGTERDIWLALRRLGHSVEVAGVSEDLRKFDRVLAAFRPHIVVNLLEEFRSEAVFDFHVISYLESLSIPFTGCNPRGMILSRGKFLIGQVAGGLGIRTPKSLLMPRGARKVPEGLPPFPLFVKLNREHASLGIRESNLVRSERQLKQTCRRLKQDFASEIIIQEYINGDDVSVSVWGNQVIEVFAPRKLQVKGARRVSTARLKFSVAYQRRHSIKTVEFKGAAAERIRREAKLAYEQLDLSGYARLDYRVSPDQSAYLIDVNANPNLSKGEDFASSLSKAGWSYIEVVENILNLGFKYRPNI